jgi:DNA processing protein
MEDLRLYQIALKNITGVGAQRAKALIKYFGGLKEVFDVPQKHWIEVLNIGPAVLKKMSRNEALEAAQQELEFIDRNKLDLLFFDDPRYPHRLSHCSDAPILLFCKGQTDLNNLKTVAVIGTRKCTNYGHERTQELIEGLVPYNALIVSGLALGVDTIAHELALSAGLPTAAVLGHSLDRIYPSANAALANKIKTSGVLISEFNHGTKPDRENFPQRNRIVAGMSDVVVVIETGVKGGSMITVSQALSYNRDVCAFPGKVADLSSAGCNWLIKKNQAHLIESAADLAFVMGWEVFEKRNATQKQLFVELDEEEELVVKVLEENISKSIDLISIACNWPTSKTASVLLNMEFKGLIRSLPGKQFCLT